MKRNMLLIVSIIAIVWIGPANAFGQGRGRGIGLGRKSDVFVNSHDARSGRFDGRGPRMNRGFFRNGIFIPRGSRIRHRMIVRDSDRDQFRRTERLNRLEMLRRERIAEQRRFGNRFGRRRP